LHPNFRFTDRLLEFDFKISAFGFIFDQQKLLIEIVGSNLQVPLILAGTKLKPILTDIYQFGYLENTPCIIARANPKSLMEELAKIGEGTYKFISPRSVGMQISGKIWQIIAIAMELDDWHQKTTYCGRCGQEFKIHGSEFGKICEACGLVDYPRLSPAIIVAIVKENRILLAQNMRFPGSMHSVLAGFVNPGETLEDAVRREIREEANIEVKNIKYFGSQAWPFPNSLMLGFTAEYAAGELKPDGKEIRTIGWFEAENLPIIPPKLSIARKLIDNFLEIQRGIKK
jgi:NAD+ diphosphatase